MSVLKIKDGNTWIPMPASGVGVPLGGTQGQVLMKASSTDYDAGWADDPSSIYIKDIACSAMTGDFVSTTDFRINSNSAVAEVTFANPSAITSDVTWTTSAGAIVLNGTCTSATTCNILLTNCSSPSDYQTPILFRNVQRTVTQNHNKDVWNMQVEFPPKSGYSRVIFGLRSDNQDVIVTGWTYSGEGNLQWMVRKYIADAVPNVTLYACLVYMPDANIWS